MAIQGALPGLISSAFKFGQGSRQRREGAGSYDPMTGKYKDPGKVERGFVMGTIANPLQALSDPNLSVQEKIATTMGLGGLFAGKYRRAKEAENMAIAQKYANIGSKIEGLPEYEVTPEALEQLKLLSETGETMKGLAGEATDIARSRTGEEAPGSAIMRDAIKQSTAQQIEAAQRQGNVMGAISSIGTQEQGRLRELAQRNLEYENQANKDLMNAMMSEAQTGAQAAGMEAQGLGTMISEKGKAYQSGLDKALTGIQFDITRQSQDQLGYQAQQEARAATSAGFSNALANIGSAYLSSKGSSYGGKTPQLASAPNMTEPTYESPTTRQTLTPSGNYGGVL